MAQSLSQVFVHFIFSTKCRFGFLTDPSIRERMNGYLAQILNFQNSPAVEVGGATDHVHLLCSLGRNNAMADLIREVKVNSSAWVKTFGGLLSKFEWQSGYGAFSVNPREVDQVREYIRNQMEHHRMRTFQEEYLEFLREYRVPYDERYIWG